MNSIYDRICAERKLFRAGCAARTANVHNGDDVMNHSAIVNDGTEHANWWALIAGIIVTVIVALSVHVVMLQVLGIAFPEDGGTAAWAKFLNNGGSVVAVIFFYSVAHETLARRNLLTRCLIVFLLYATLKESFRGLIMAGYVTTAWTYATVDRLPSLLLNLVISCMVVVVTPRLRGALSKIIGGSLIAAVAIFGVRPLIGAVFGPLKQSIAYLNHDDVYQVPYGLAVLVPAYITFIEPVLSCMIIVALVWNRRSAKPLLRLVQFVALIMFMRGMVFRTFIFGFYIKSSLGAAMLSESQFALETLALAVLTALIWQYSMKHSQVMGPSLTNPHRRHRRCPTMSSRCLYSKRTRAFSQATLGPRWKS
jgi:hypothetical protein